MRPSLLIASVAVFVGAIFAFSRAYNTLLAFFKQPSLAGLLEIALFVALLFLSIAALGFIMYATDRRKGNIKVKSPFFERLLGYRPDAELPTRDGLAVQAAKKEQR